MSNKLIKYIAVILATLLIVSVVFNVVQCTRKVNNEIEYREIEKTVTVRDTIIEFKYKTDTVFNTKTNTEYKYLTLNDTVYIENKPQIYKYNEPNYDLEVQAVKLDWHKLDIHATQTFRDTITVTNTVIQKKKNHWGVGVQVGAGYGIINKKPDIFVGLGVSYNF